MLAQRTRRCCIALTAREGAQILGEAVCSLLAPSMLVSQLDKEWMPPLNSDYDEAKAQVVRHVEYNPGLPRALLSTLRYFPLASMQPTYESLRDHDRPVLLLWGDSDETTPYSAAQQLVRMLPRVSARARPTRPRRPQLIHCHCADRVLGPAGQAGDAAQREAPGSAAAQGAVQRSHLRVSAGDGEGAALLARELSDSRELSCIKPWPRACSSFATIAGAATA